MRVQYQCHLWSEMNKSCQKSSNNVAGCRLEPAVVLQQLKLISHGSKVSWWTKSNTYWCWWSWSGQNIDGTRTIKKKCTFLDSFKLCQGTLFFNRACSWDTIKLSRATLLTIRSLDIPRILNRSLVTTTETKTPLLSQSSTGFA